MDFNNGSNDPAMSPQEQMLREIRRRDPFYYFSIPGALIQSFELTGGARGEESAAQAIAALASNDGVRRRTRVSCEAHYIELLQDMFSDGEEETIQEERSVHDGQPRNGVERIDRASMAVGQENFQQGYGSSEEGNVQRGTVANSSLRSTDRHSSEEGKEGANGSSSPTNARAA